MTKNVLAYCSRDIGREDMDLFNSIAALQFFHLIWEKLHLFANIRKKQSNRNPSNWLTKFIDLLQKAQAPFTNFGNFFAINFETDCMGLWVNM